MMRVCLGLPGTPCGKLTPKRRCSDCARKYEAQRGPRRMVGRYDRTHERLRAAAIREHPWCANCGAPHTEDNPLTADHVVPHRSGGKNVRSNYAVLCRRCNSAKGARVSTG